MADQTESKHAFWSSVPGIFSGLGAVIVAVTGLITALYSTGVIGSNANTNSNASKVNTAAALASTPAPANPEHERFKSLAGKWEVLEEPSQYFDKVDKVTWQYEATVTGNVLTLTGKITAIDGDKNISEEDTRIRGTLVATPVDSGIVGKNTLRRVDGSEVTNRATMTIQDDLKEFTGSFKEDGSIYTHTGRKQ